MTDLKKQIVQSSFLASAIEKLGIHKYLLMSKGDVKNNVQNEAHVKEDLCEALFGAIAIDSGWNIEVLEKVIDKVINLNHSVINGVEDGTDYVSFVHNWHQKQYGTEPAYKFNDNSDDKIFTCELYLYGYGEYFDGFGYSKKEAIKLCAKRAYDFISQKEGNYKNIIGVIGSFSLNDAVSKLQMLKDKKMINTLDFIFREIPAQPGGNGNPSWECECLVNGTSYCGSYCSDKKVDAKKAAAYSALHVIVTGRDNIKELLINQNTSKNYIKGEKA